MHALVKETDNTIYLGRYAFANVTKLWKKLSRTIKILPGILIKMVWVQVANRIYVTI